MTATAYLITVVTIVVFGAAIWWMFTDHDGPNDWFNDDYEGDA